MRGTTATIESVSRAPGQCLLALLGGKVSSHAARRLALCSENWSASRGRPSSANVAGRARTPTLMPGRSLTRPCPGTGTPPSQFVSGLSACLSLQRARITRLDARTSRFQPTRFYARTLSCALSASQPRPCGARLETRASRSQPASSLPPAFRALPPAGTVFRRAVRPTSRRRRQSVFGWASQDPRACARRRSRLACLRHRAPSRDLSGRRCLTPDLNRHVHCAFADAPQTARPLRSVAGASQSGDRQGTAPRARR